MKFNIDTIMSHIGKNFFAKAQYYHVKIMGGNPADATDDIMLNCSAINIPGINIGFNPDKRHGIGIITNYPNGKAFTEINMTFYESEKENERKYFVEWLDSIYDKNSHKFNFYEEYTKNIIIDQYNRTGKLVYTITMNQCFPTSVAQLDRGYGLDGISQFSVAFQFYDFNEKYWPDVDRQDPHERGNSAVNMVPDLNRPPTAIV